MKRRIGVVGVGSAGLLNVMHLCVWLDKSWEVYSIHDPKKKILGIGESTNGGFVNTLERATNFSLAHAPDMAALDATIKYGSRFVNWREQQWINPLLNGNIAVHFNNRNLKQFTFERLARLWPDQFRTLEGDVQSIVDRGDKATLTIDGAEHDFDYVVDCRGTPDTFDGYVVSDCTLLDRCLVHRVEGYDFEPFTDHIATKHGWMFGVPLRGWKTYGYLYSQKLTDKAVALEDMKSVLGATTLDAAHYDTEYVLTSYYAKQLVSGRVCRNGNRALFFEPLIANSIFLYLRANRLIFDYIVNGVTEEQVNRAFVKSVQEMEDVISYYYQGGSMHRSEFWKAATESAQQRLGQRREFLEYLGQLRALKAEGVLHRAPGYAWAAHTWQVVDAQLGYNYIEGEPPAPSDEVTG